MVLQTTNISVTPNRHAQNCFEHEYTWFAKTPKSDAFSSVGVEGDLRVLVKGIMAAPTGYPGFRFNIMLNATNKKTQLLRFCKTGVLNLDFLVVGNAGAVVPGHACHEKGLQRQKGVDPLVSNQERRAAVDPVINRG